MLLTNLPLIDKKTGYHYTLNFLAIQRQTYVTKKCSFHISQTLPLIYGLLPDFIQLNQIMTKFWKTGYNSVNLNYKKHNQIPKLNKNRNIIWFNPLFNKNAITNIAKRFLNLVDKHFRKSVKLHQIFNRNTIKVSYSCKKYGKFIHSPNKKIINEKTKNMAPTIKMTSFTYL